MAGKTPEQSEGDQMRSKLTEVLMELAVRSGDEQLIKQAHKISHKAKKDSKYRRTLGRAAEAAVLLFVEDIKEEVRQEQEAKKRRRAGSN